MNQKYWKYIIPLLLAGAVALGLFQRNEIKDFVGYKKSITKFDSPSADSLEGYYQKSQEMSKSQNGQNNTVTFLAVGDIMLSRNVAGTIQKANDPLLPFKNFADVLKSSDFNFGNLESPISGSSFFSNTGSLVFNAPTQYTKGLSEYNFKVLNLANNHAFDQGLDGLIYTEKFLDGLNILHMGTGTTTNAAWEPVILEKNGIKIGFIGASYASVNDGGKTKNNYVARMEDLENLKSAISNLKSTCDFVVVTMHAGTEYTRTPNDLQVTFAHAAIDDGADIVIGAHPHWVQTVEKYNGKYIFYSLGNFIFDQEWSQETKEGLALKIELSKPGSSKLQGPAVQTNLDSVELIPLIVENYSTPRPATAIESEKILGKIGETEKILH